MSQEEGSRVRHPRVDRRQIERRALDEDNYFIDLLDSFSGYENESDLEGNEMDNYGPGTRDSDEISTDSENDENLPPTNESQGVKRRRRQRSDPGDEWEWAASNFQPRDFIFDSSGSGITSKCNVNENSKEVDYFFEFFDNEFMGLIAEETNRYQRFLVDTLGDAVPKYLRKFAQVTVEEMIRFLCVIMIMSHISKHRIVDYWTTLETFETKGVRRLMARDRFLQILRVLHFVDNSQETSPDNKLKKIKPVLDSVRRKFREKFQPFQDLCIDESLMLWKGRLSFKQYIPDKRSRFGVKIFELCDAKTDYIVDFIIYTGKDTEILVDEDLGVSGSVVKTFMASHLGKHHILYFDNWYCSPKLLKYLGDNETGACGTVRKNRKFMPKFPDVNKSEISSQNCNGILGLKWQDNRTVYMLSSVHENIMVDCEKRCRPGEFVQKPACVVDYNKKMRIVDKNDMLISSVKCIRKTTRWYIKLFFRLLDMILVNCHHLHGFVTGKKGSYLQFSKSVVLQLIERYPPAPNKIITRTVITQPRRLTERHFPDPVPSTEKQLRPRLRCRVCSHTSRRPKKGQQTYFMCKDCNVGLCVAPCFREYHTLLNY